jgi:hypothetical protein
METITAVAHSVEIAEAVAAVTTAADLSAETVEAVAAELAVHSAEAVVIVVAEPVEVLAAIEAADVVKIRTSAFNIRCTSRMVQPA